MAEAGKVSTFHIDMPRLGVAGRRAWVYLPPDYAGSGRRYPVLYMQDGQNLFCPETSYCGDWGVNGSLDALFREGKTKGAIVIGVDNGGTERWNEYAPWPKDDGTGDGSGDKYARFIVETLKPLVDAKFRTLPGRESTAIAGSSLGAVISFYSLFKYPEIFSRAGLFSPAFWFARDRAFGLVKDTAIKRDLRIYMDVGTKEDGREDEYLADARGMAGLFSGEKNIKQRFVVDEGGRHNEKAWARRFPAAFLWLLEGS
jgi:predicted alpha/beta superfamily hydrolase